MTARTTTEDTAAVVYLTADDILAADDRLWEDVPVPEWGGMVRVRGLQGHERDKYEQSLHDSKGRTRIDNARAKLAQLCMVDPKTGQLLFAKEQVAALGRKSAAALQRVFNVAMRLSGLSEEDMEELEGN